MKGKVPVVWSQISYNNNNNVLSSYLEHCESSLGSRAMNAGTAPVTADLRTKPIGLSHMDENRLINTISSVQFSKDICIAQLSRTSHANMANEQ